MILDLFTKFVLPNYQNYNLENKFIETIKKIGK